MAHVLTVKIPESLLQSLEKACAKVRKTKGAFVREAIESLLTAKVLQNDPPGEVFDREHMRRVTRDILKGKKINAGIDWEDLRRKASQGVNPYMSPEEEVMAFRRRGM